jgi:hypothetical protein
MKIVLDVPDHVSLHNVGENLRFTSLWCQKQVKVWQDIADMRDHRRPFAQGRVREYTKRGVDAAAMKIAFDAFLQEKN